MQTTTDRDEFVPFTWERFLRGAGVEDDAKQQKHREYASLLHREAFDETSVHLLTADVLRDCGILEEQDISKILAFAARYEDCLGVVRDTCIGRAGNFYLVEKWNIGSYSAVYLGANIESGDQVVLKVAKQEDGPTGNVTQCNRELLRHEYEMLNRVKDHPRIVGLRESGREFDVNLIQRQADDFVTDMLVLEVCTNDLEVVVQRTGCIVEKHCRNWMLDILDALEHCHKRGVLHRDLKPSQVLVALDFVTLRLSDFNHSAAQEDDEEFFFDRIGGTPEYFAPEIRYYTIITQRMAKHEVSEEEYDDWMREMSKEGFWNRVDVWGLGRILYFMLTGCEPFHHCNYDKDERFRAWVDAEDNEEDLKRWWESAMRSATKHNQKFLRADFGESQSIRQRYESKGQEVPYMSTKVFSRLGESWDSLGSSEDSEAVVGSAPDMLSSSILALPEFKDGNDREAAMKESNAVVNISSEAKDLLQRMLRVDRYERITMAEIRQHPWFSSEHKLATTTSLNDDLVRRFDKIDKRFGYFPLNSSMLNIIKRCEEEEEEEELSLGGDTRRWKPWIIGSILAVALGLSCWVWKKGWISKSSAPKK